MAAVVCRAKDPNSCRVHGSGGRFEELQQLADEAAVVGDIALYMKTREEMETLSDDEPENFIAPDTGNLIIDNWVDSQGNIISEAPNDMLLSNLYQSSFMPVRNSEQIEEMLEDRGYNSKDLFLAKHYRFKKDDPDSYTSEVTAMEIHRACNSIQEELDWHPDAADKEAFINNNFFFPGYSTDISKAKAQEFADEYRGYLKLHQASAILSYKANQYREYLDRE